MPSFCLKCFELDEETLESREVVDVDIAYDELPEKHYVPEEVRTVVMWYFYVIYPTEKAILRQSVKNDI